MYDKLYENVFPTARQYGMSPNEFWHGDIRLFEVYQKGYYKNVSYTAWCNGRENLTAHGLALKGAFGGLKKSDTYPNWEDLSEKLYKPKPKVKNVEEEFRQQQSRQVSWIASLIRGDKE